jgi:hypothetical protein
MAVIYIGYFTAFAQHLQLLNTVPSGAVARITMAPGGDDKWSWLEIHLPLAERLNLENKA